MNFVIDPGALAREPHAARLQAFLAMPENQVVLTDFALTEACNGANVTGLRNTFRLIAAHPAQIQVLRPTPQIARLLPPDPGLFIDPVESNKVRTFLYDLFRDEPGLEARVRARAEAAQQRIAPLLQAGEQVRTDFKALLTLLPAAEVAILRREGRLTRPLSLEVLRVASNSAGELFRDYCGVPRPVPEVLIHTFLFRFALATTVRSLLWGLAGGLDQVASAKLRNDVTDSTYCAYATFYDDLVTADTKLQAAYANTAQLVRVVLEIAERE